jgi:hypothetical protein
VGRPIAQRAQGQPLRVIEEAMPIRVDGKAPVDDDAGLVVPRRGVALPEDVIAGVTPSPFSSRSESAAKPVRARPVRLGGAGKGGPLRTQERLERGANNDLSGHCAPSIHRHIACAVPRLRHLEWFQEPAVRPLTERSHVLQTISYGGSKQRSFSASASPRHISHAAK